jgi:hypothetical protein
VQALLKPLKSLGRAIAVVPYGGRPSRVLSPEQRVHWNDRGYLVLPRHFSQSEVDGLNAHVDEHWRDASHERSRTVVDVFIGTPQERRMRLCDAPPEARRYPHKLSDLYLESVFVRQFVLETRLAAILADLLEGWPLVCNSLNLEFGSQQRDHTDSLYMPAPDRRHLVASWVALEDGSTDSGPLRYYPGSHHIPPFVFSTGDICAVDGEMPRFYEFMARELGERCIVAETFIPKAGDVFIWHGQLYHGGEPIRNRELTRKSVVTHYWRARDVLGLHGRVGSGGYWLRRSTQPVDGSVDDH